ncbi:MAG: ABC transporter substrate-binding protein, partial [Promethearchaeota archaeon]
MDGNQMRWRISLPAITGPLIILLLLCLHPIIQTGSNPHLSSRNRTQSSVWNPTGPYADRVIFHVISGEDDQVTALLQGQIDCLTDNVEEQYVPDLDQDSNIQLTQTPHLGFGFMAINCERYPFSIPAFRRALAFAINKSEIAEIMWGNLGIPADNPVLPSTGVWHNNQTYPDYTTSNVAAAKAELAAAGFFDLDGDGFVEAPDASAFLFQPFYIIESPQWRRALSSMQYFWNQSGIPTKPQPLPFGIILDFVYRIPRNYDAACFCYELSPNPLILEDFMSQYIQHPERNILNWANATYDYYIDQMLNLLNYDDVRLAAHTAQQVFVENAPLIALYTNYEVNAYRTNRWENFIVIPGWG